MNKNPRYLEKQIKEDLKKKMVFLSGPRQVGKTTLSKRLLKEKGGLYLNWDIPNERQRFLKQEFSEEKLWVFDEIHKYRAWRNSLKGIYDAHAKTHQILVTGSGRLDLYRRGGDSLQGRYHLLRLYPYTVAELKIENQKDFETLFKLGGFPEPYFSQSQKEARRWTREYRTRILEEDITQLEQVQDLGNLEALMIALPSRVCSPLSINSLREDLQVAHKTVSNWLEILERLYFIFRLKPFGAKKLRAIKKDQKHYHFDWNLLDEDGPRFENLVAVHLQKWVHYQQDVEGYDDELLYFRDIDLREVDFILTRKGKVTQAIECKLKDEELGKGLLYFKAKFPQAECWQISAFGQKDYLSKEGIRVSPALRFLRGLI
ncbi:MAG: ATP-binding protein [Deltaproteobacteria bacterium]|nr:ATP-binding protein [Deltaproteobacteria bacterium]